MQKYLIKYFPGKFVSLCLDMFVKVKNWFREFRLSLRMKISLALSAIAVVLLMSSIISWLEYRHMSNYVSSLIAGNVNNIHRTQELVDAVDAYNLEMLAVIGGETLTAVPAFDKDGFLRSCEDLKENLGNGPAVTWADSVVYAYSAYMLASTELEEVFELRVEAGGDCQVCAGLSGGVRQLEGEGEDFALAAVGLHRQLAERVEELVRDARVVDEVVELQRKIGLRIDGLLEGRSDGIAVLPVEPALLIHGEGGCNLASGKLREGGEGLLGVLGGVVEFRARLLVEVRLGRYRGQRLGVDGLRRILGRRQEQGVELLQQLLRRDMLFGARRLKIGLIGRRRR